MMVLGVTKTVRSTNLLCSVATYCESVKIDKVFKEHRFV